MTDMQQAVDAKKDNVNDFMAKRNVVGVGVGFKNRLGEETGETSVVVLVQNKKPLAALSEEDMIPKEIDGIKTDVVEIGFLRAQGINPKQRFRPVIQPGASMAHYLVGAGTLGAVVRHRDTGERFMLSNNHVFANSNSSNIGDSILQPSALDGGVIPGDIIGQLAAFRRLAYIEEATPEIPTEPLPGDTPGEEPSVPAPTRPPTTNDSGCDFMDFLVALANVLANVTGSTKRVQTAQAASVVAQSTAGAVTGSSPAEVPFIAQQSLDNLLDAAIARPNNPAILSDEILQIGRVTGTKPATLGMNVAKFGRSTGYTTGKITLLDATVNVQYDTPAGTRTARFVNQIISTGMSKSGDSGSLVVDPSDNRAVGLLFAGSDFATLFTPIDRVLSYFNVEF